MKDPSLILSIFLLGAMLPPTVYAQVRGILNKPAPNWGVTEWINLPKGTTSFDLSNLKGNVVYLYFFQSWCPGCHSSGFPTLTAAYEALGHENDVAFVTIQTAFEGPRHNTFEKAKEVAEKYDLSIPVGHVGDGRNLPAIMKNYRSGGTPWTVIIDKKGIVRFNDFHIQPTQATDLIQNLLKE